MTEKLTIRTATVADAATLAQIHVEGWRGAYGGIVEQEYLDSLTTAQRQSDWERWFGEAALTVLLAFDEQGTSCGFCSYGKLRTPLPGSSPIRPLYTGEIYALYVLPGHWRQGVGTALLREGVAALRSMKHKSMCLWVLEKNERAVSFYKKHGGERCGKKDIQIGKKTVREICFGWRNTDVQFGENVAALP